MRAGCGCFFVKFEESQAFDICFRDEEEFKICFGEVITVQHGYDPYPGPYEVIPKAWEEQILATNGKNMEANVTVYEVPYDEVSNQYGTTVTIAS